MRHLLLLRGSLLSFSKFGHVHLEFYRPQYFMWKQQADKTLFNRPYVTRISAIVFNLAVKLNLVRPWGPSNDIESGHVNTRAEAERRRSVHFAAPILSRKMIADESRSLDNRALALKALDQRLANKPATSTSRASGSGPSLTGASGSSSTQTAGDKPGSSGDVMFDAGDEATSTPLPKERD